ncbi:MAG: response regulator [Anaerolineaceae bacterium]|nr:MAG: response regulator [Anaerolineaceae bacterium]
MSRSAIKRSMSVFMVSSFSCKRANALSTRCAIADDVLSYPSYCPIVKQCAMIGRKLLNRYKLTEHLGDGSTATVYRATDETLGRDVALKVLLPHVKDTTRERFFQEAKSAGALNHPNIMSIHDIGQDGTHSFLVTEYVDGVALSDYVPSSADVVVDLGHQIAMALHYAHERHIIHRDIKPANIKVTPEGKVKIMDLGLALTQDAKRVTAHGMVIGTPAYLSPEQAQGIKLDPRTDIYSLGIVLYEMATGQLPFNSDDIGALLLQQVKQPPTPPRLIIADLPMALESVILRCLEKSPARRYQSSMALANALAAVLPQTPATTSATDATTSATRQSPAVAPRRPSNPTQRRTLRVLLADDHTILRRSLAGLLETHDDFIVVGEAGDGQNALQQAIAIQPDVLVLDINMPIRNGLDILPDIRQQAPNVKVLILTGREEDAYIIRALRAGAHGYMLKSSEEDELIAAIRNVTTGQLVLGKGVAEKMVTGMLSSNAPDGVTLSETEQKILLYIAGGYENDEIAATLKIDSIDLIEMIAVIMDKLNGKDRYDTALKALRNGYILLDDLHDLSRER